MSQPYDEQEPLSKDEFMSLMARAEGKPLGAYARKLATYLANVCGHISQLDYSRPVARVAGGYDRLVVCSLC